MQIVHTDTNPDPHFLVRKQFILGMAVFITLVSAVFCELISLVYGIDPSAQLNTLGFSLIAISGTVILYKQWGNRVGWALYATGMVYVLAEVFYVYAYFTLVTRPGALPLGAFASWLAVFTWVPGFFPTTAVFLLFPNGRPLSPRWWWVLRLSGAVCLPATVLTAALLWPYRGAAILQGNGDIAAIPTIGPLINQTIFIEQPLEIALIIAAVISLFLRFRSARGMERQQLKWILFACATVPISMLLNLPLSNNGNQFIIALGQSINILGVLFFPVAFAIAVTRYRLYEIDVIIRRTLVYSILTIILAGLYFGSVLVLQAVFVALSGQTSPVSLVLSTLLIATVFTSLRRRIQRIIDRRFYRKQYNAEKMLEAFHSIQRESVELEQIETYLLQVVDETLQPEWVTLQLMKK